MTFFVMLIVFFVSGFAALLYQVIWQRMLAIFSRADVHSVTIIVAAFMAGLGIGHLAGGRVADTPDGYESYGGETRFPFWFWALACGFAGFVALSYEIVWFRLLGVLMKSTAFTFGTLLTPP